jgi:hypothetical protein
VNDGRDDDCGAVFGGFIKSGVNIGSQLIFLGLTL